MTQEQINEGNKLIAKFMGQVPEIEYCVGNVEKGTIAYSPKNIGNYFTFPSEQKAECERYLGEQKVKYPDGWITKEGYDTRRFEWYKQYDSSWDWLMPVVEKISKIPFDIENDDGKDTSYPRTFGMINDETGNFMFRFNRHQLFEAETLIVTTWLAVIDFIKSVS